MTDCVFCSIARGESSAPIVYADEHTIAFLDIRPVFHGHTLVVPRAHHATLPDLPDELLDPTLRTARLVARAVQEGLGADGTFVGMNNTVSQSVAHLHLHVVPRRRKDGLRGFFWPRTTYADAEHTEQVRAVIAAAAERIASEGNR